MNRVILTIGAILLIGSIIMLFVSSFMMTVQLKLVRRKFNSWEISSELEEGTTYVVDITSSREWTDAYMLGYPEQLVPLDIVIVAPDGGTISLTAFLYGEPSSSPWYKYRYRPKIVSVEYRNIDSNCIEVDEDYSPIRFTVKHGYGKGVYTIRIINETLYWSEGPPEKIVIQKEIVKFQDSYLILSNGGVALLAVGVVVTAVGIKTKPKFKKKTRFMKKVLKRKR